MHKERNSGKEEIAASLRAATTRVADSFSSVGTDVVQISRFQRSIESGGDNFLKRCFTEAERAYCESKSSCAQHFAGRFAAKEAVFKALRLDWNGPFSWKRIEILADAVGRPIVRLDTTLTSSRLEPSQENSQSVQDTSTITAGPPRLDVSISHTGDFAIAVATSTDTSRPSDGAKEPDATG